MTSSKPSNSPALRIVLGDQLSRSLSSLREADPAKDIVLMMEVHDETTYVRHHKQKIALVLSAMRHFAESLRKEGFQVEYVRLNDPGNTGSFSGEIQRAVAKHHPEKLILTWPGEWRVLQEMRVLEQNPGIAVCICEDDRFFCSLEEFREWSGGKKGLRMEFFYRWMRKKTGWLMQADEPEGGKWNFDTENRKSIPKDFPLPARVRFEPDEITREVLELAGEKFPEHFGDLDGFSWPVTREQALEALADFVELCLPRFGDFQDAMKTGEDFLFHSLLSTSLNIGLLLPREVCQAAIEAYEKGAAPLAATEGFLRQILGWREYVRGIYWTKMPEYAQTNFLEAKRPLPDFYWTAETEMRCVKEAVLSTRRNAYAHHIQRLMITGNFALLAGIEPRAVEEWYLAVYADAFEWVELPNTHGMALHADGGLLGSKPYAASGAYIDRMSDYCKGCAFHPKIKLGEKACPFNYLYWNFLIENQERLKRNPRMSMPYNTLKNLEPSGIAQIQKESTAFLEAL